MRILIAEDEPISRLILQTAVERFDHECLVTEDGIEAWDVFQRASVDVLISDLNMPGMDGIELCRRVRSHVQAEYTYFIFLTALGEKTHILTGIEAGADDYLPKPLDPDELRVRLLVAARITALHRRLAGQTEELERLNRQSFEEGRTDSLTQLGNRLRLREDLEVLMSRADRYGQSWCAVMCDIDYFKLYNDHNGHLAGDEVLRAVAHAIKKTCRTGDGAYRYGGEEFLLLLPQQSLDSAIIAAGRLRGAIENLAIPHEANPPARVVTISAGVAALSPPECKTAQQWLQETDAALYCAKQAGRNRVLGPESAALLSMPRHR